MVINLIIWLAVGLMAGLAAHLSFDRDNKYVVGTLLSGAVGAFVGGITFFAVSIGSLANALEPVSIFWALIGALVLLGFVMILVKSEDPGKLTHST